MLKTTHVKKRILITGGSSGIGYAIAEQYANEGHTLFLISKTINKLEAAKAQLKAKFPDCIIHIFSADVSAESEIKTLYKQLCKLTESIDILICNAGVLLCGKFESNTPEESRKNFETNYWGMHYSVFHFLPLLKNADHPHVAFVSSVAGYTGLFGYSHYSPSKFAVAGLAECLRMEFKDIKIGVSVIYPPDTETPMLEHERLNTLPECKALSKGARSISARKAAVMIIKGIQMKKFEIYFNFESKLIRLLKGLIPSLYYIIVDHIVRTSRK